MTIATAVLAMAAVAHPVAMAGGDRQAFTAAPAATALYYKLAGAQLKSKSSDWTRSVTAAGELVRIKHDDGAGVTLSKDGFFLNSSRFFYPVGVNYWPASTGCNLWTAKPFPSAEIQHDLDVLAASPFNSLRIFIEWGALAPTEGGFDEEKFANLALMLGWIKQRGLLVDISTFMGWMSGRHYWPSWKRGRNMYTDATMVSRTVAFASKVAKTAAPFRANLLAMEFGNEMDCCTDDAPTKDIIAWTRLIYAAFKQNAGASVLVVPGTDENTIIGKSTWPLGGVTGRIAGDVLNFHPYPVLFTPTKGDGFRDAVTQAGPTYDGSFVRAFGPSLMQEWGTLVTGGVTQQDTYLRKVLPEAMGNGVCGWLYWCMRDIDGNKTAPYNTTGLETQLGLFGADDKIKPGLTFYADFAKTAARMSAPNGGKRLPEDDPDAIGLYVPRHYYASDDPANPGNTPPEQSGHATLAYALLRALDETTVVVRGDLALPAASERKVLVVTSSNLVVSEILALGTYVKGGGKLIWHGLSSSYFAGDAKAASEALVGATCTGGLCPKGTCAPLSLTVQLDSKRFTLPSSAYLRGDITAAPHLNTTGTLHAATRVWLAKEYPVIMMTLSQRSASDGGGAVFASVAAVDSIALALMGQPKPRSAWAGWFKYALKCVRGGCKDEPNGNTSMDADTAPIDAAAQVESTSGANRGDAGALPKDALVYGATAPSAVALKQLRALGVRTAAVLPPLRSPSSLRNATLLVVETDMPLPDMDQAFAWLVASQDRCVIWSGFSTASLNRALYTAAGVAAVDFRTPRPSAFSAFGQRWDITTSDCIEFSASAPVQRPEWGAAKAVAVDDRGIAVLHRHQSAAGGVFVLSSLQVEVAAGMPAAETKAWFAGLLSLCQATNSTRASESGSDRLVSAIVTPI